MISPMVKLSTLTYLCLSYYFATVAYASNDLTSQNFTVTLSDLDPLGSAGRSTPPGGVGAFMKLLGSITDILLFMIPIFAAVSLMIAGYFYIFSAGDSEKAGRAKTIIKWNIVAMLVAFLSYGIVKIVASFFTPV